MASQQPGTVICKVSLLSSIKTGNGKFLGADISRLKHVLIVELIRM